MKQIHILYNTVINKDQKKIADRLSGVLKKNGYKVTSYGFQNDEQIKDYVSTVTPHNCQLILTINMTAFSFVTTENSTALNTLPMNIVNYIDISPEIFKFQLEKRVNYTMSFIVSSSSAKQYITTNFPHIFHVDATTSIQDFLPDYLEKLDWRY